MDGFSLSSLFLWPVQLLTEILLHFFNLYCAVDFYYSWSISDAARYTHSKLNRRGAFNQSCWILDNLWRFIVFYPVKNLWVLCSNVITGLLASIWTLPNYCHMSKWLTQLLPAFFLFSFRLLPKFLKYVLKSVSLWANAQRGDFLGSKEGSVRSF